MRLIFLAPTLIVAAGCVPGGEEAVELCREEAGEVIAVEGADYEQRRNRHIEHCMRAFGYVWDEGRTDCDHYQQFREGVQLSEDATEAGRCFRSAYDDRSRLTERILSWFD